MNFMESCKSVHRIVWEVGVCVWVGAKGPAVEDTVWSGHCLVWLGCHSWCLTVCPLLTRSALTVPAPPGGTVQTGVPSKTPVTRERRGAKFCCCWALRVGVWISWSSVTAAKCGGCPETKWPGSDRRLLQGLSIRRRCPVLGLSDRRLFPVWFCLWPFWTSQYNSGLQAAPL